MSILTVTLNPAIDVSASVPSVVPQHKLRCHDVRRDPGGGGINVARVLRCYGADVRALFTAGGPLGQLLERLMIAEGVPHTAIAIAGDTREDFTIGDAASGAQYRFVMPGPRLAPAELAAAIGAAAGTGASIVVASGSLPPEAPPGTWRRLRAALPPEVFFALDTSGAALAAALGPGIGLIKPNLRELSALLDTPLPDRAARIAAARRLVAEERTEAVALTLGEEGALYIGRGFAFEAQAPAVTAQSTVGAGDSFLGALLWAQAQGQAPELRLRHAVAAGTAALLKPGTDLCHPRDAAALFDRVAVHPIPD